MSPNNAQSGSNAIEAREIDFTYADGTEAVNGLTLVIPEGEFFGFLGPNGAGKTTMIKMLVTLLRPTNGQITVHGSDVTDDPHSVRDMIGYMAQETSIDPDFTARENLRFACELHHVPRGDRTKRIEELLDLVDLSDVADKQAETFSGGMQKRLDVATALVHDPSLIFLDEPTTGLDPRARNRLWEYFREINNNGTTVFLTTQYLEEADYLCERIAVIADGEIVAMGSPSDLKAEVGGDVLDIGITDAADHRLDRASSAVHDAGVLEPTEAVAVHDDGITITSPRAREVGPDLIVALKEAGIPVTGFNVHSPTLDDVFLTITGDSLDQETPHGPDHDEGAPVKAEAER